MQLEISHRGKETSHNNNEHNYRIADNNIISYIYNINILFALMGY